MPASTLQDKLSQVESDLDTLRDKRAAAVTQREAAKEAFAGGDTYDTESKEFKDAESAVKAVGEIDDKIANAQASQVGILKMLGQKDPNEGSRRQNARREDAAIAAWDSEALLAADEVMRDLVKASTSKARMGGIELGQVVSRDTLVNMLAADITGTANMRDSSYVGVLPQLHRPLRILDLLNIGTTDGNSVPYTVEGGTFGAAETAESTEKPEDGVTYTDATAAVQTIAAWQKLRKQALADFPALRTIIDGRLRYSVMRRLEAQVIAGNGTDPNIRGIMNTSGIGTVAYDGGVEIADLILTGITQVYLADAMPNGVVAHPTDWKTMLTAKASGDGQYFSGGPFSVTPQVIWGVPLVPSPAIALGHSLVGDFEIGASLLIREGVNVLLSDSDQNDFIKNRVTILGETRAALPVWRPAAFSDVDISAAA